MEDVGKCRLVAGELRECAKQFGPLSHRARMLILAERLEAVAGAADNSDNDLVQLALGVYARLKSESVLRMGRPGRRSATRNNVL
jgi:hypothetical protein